ARRLVQRHERIEQRGRRLAVGRLQDVPRPAAGQAGAHEAVVVMLADGAGDLEVARLLELGGGQRQARRGEPARRRTAHDQLAAVEVDELAELLVALPQPAERVGGGPARLGPPLAGRADPQLRPAFDQRQLLDEKRQRLGGATHQVPAPRVLVAGRSRQRRREPVLRPDLAVGDAVKEPRRRLTVEGEPDGRRRALVRRRAALRQRRQRRQQAAAPTGLPGRIRAVAIADREEPRLVDPAGDGALLVARERRRERELVDERRLPRQVLAQREQALEQ